MRYYANPSTLMILDAIHAGDLGAIVTPKQGNIIPYDEVDWCADNGCFSDAWRESHWWAWLRNLPRSCRFAVAPDVFLPSAESHAATLARWADFGPAMRRHGFPVAFVAQVGCTADAIPADADALFIGGTTEWKLSHDAAACVAEAKRRGMWVHMGRVNSERRLRIAASWGVDSADGTYLTFGPDCNLPRLLGWLRRLEQGTQMSILQ